MIKRLMTAIACIFASVGTVLACTGETVPDAVAESTEDLVCNAEWTNMQKVILRTHGFDGANSVEGGETVIRTERLIAALNTLDGASPGRIDGARAHAGAALADDATVRSIVRAALFHLAFSDEEIGNYCEHLVDIVDRPSITVAPVPPAIQAFKKAVRCGM